MERSNTKNLVLYNIKVLLSSINYGDEEEFFITLKVGQLMNKSENRRKIKNNAFYQFDKLTLKIHQQNQRLQIDFMKKQSQTKNKLICKTSIAVENIMQSTNEQIKLPLAFDYRKVGWIYFEYDIDQKVAKKRQLLYLQKIQLSLQYSERGLLPFLEIKTSNNNSIKITQAEQLSFSKANFDIEIQLPIKLTDTIIIQVHNKNSEETLYYDVHFLVQTLNRGVQSQLKLPLNSKKKNKKVGEFTIYYCLEHKHLCNDHLSAFGSSNLMKTTTSSNFPQSNFLHLQKKNNMDFELQKQNAGDILDQLLQTPYKFIKVETNKLYNFTSESGKINPKLSRNL